MTDADARTRFLDDLRDLRRRAGTPSYRELATHMTSVGPVCTRALADLLKIEYKPLGHSVLNDLVLGKHLTAPDAWTVSMYALACVSWGAQHGSAVVAEPSSGALRELLARLHQRRTDYEISRQHAAEERSPGAEVRLTPLVRVLLAAQRDAAASLPYRLLTERVPPLSKLYVEQESNHEAAVNSPITIRDALATTMNVLLTATAGGGKTTLLHHLVEESAVWWLDGGVGSPPLDKVIPVRVRASRIAERTFSEAIADTVNRELGEYLDAPVPDDIFRTAPAPGLRWLVLVDGLDEIIDAWRRERVIKALARRFAEDHELYRVVIASRPLSSQDLAPLYEAGIPHYHLRPFNHDQLRSFAENWYRSQRSPDAVGDADRFLASIKRSRLAAIVALPLLATIAVVVHERTSDESLPTTKAGLYQRFFHYMLDVRQKTCHARLALVETLDPHPNGRDIGEWLFTNTRPLLEHISARHLLGHGTGTILARAVAWLHEKCPWPLDVIPDVEDCLRAMLIGTGILTARQDDFDFTHQSFAEYFAAGALARELDDQLRTGDVKHWIRLATDDTTEAYALFAVGRWVAQEPSHDPRRFVERLIDGQPRHVLIAAALVADGIGAGGALEAAVCTALGAVTDHPSYAVGAVLALGRLPDRTRVATVLRDLVRGSGSPWCKLASARQLLILGHRDEAVAALKELLHNQKVQVAVAMDLDNLGHREHARKHLESAVGRGEGSVEIAETLVRLGSIETARQWAWAKYADDEDVFYEETVRVLIFLTKLGDHQALSLLIPDVLDEVEAAEAGLMPILFSTGFAETDPGFILAALARFFPDSRKCELAANDTQDRPAVGFLRPPGDDDLWETIRTIEMGNASDVVKLIFTNLDAFSWNSVTEWRIDVRRLLDVMMWLKTLLGKTKAADELESVVMDTTRQKSTRIGAAMLLDSVAGHERAQSALTAAIGIDDDTVRENIDIMFSNAAKDNDKDDALNRIFGLAWSRHG